MVMVMIFNGFVEDSLVVAAVTVVNLLAYLVLVYVHLFFLLPQCFLQKKYWSYSVGLLLLLLMVSVFRYWVGWVWLADSNFAAESTFKPSFYGSISFSGIFIILISIPLQLIDNWFKKYELEKELKTHQLEAELRFLKAQVNPHFLFNTLNNIYSLSVTESKQAPEMILKLSDMMSYMLYDCKHEQVSLSSEIDYLRNYIALQQLKKDNELRIDFTIKGEIDQVMITPMLFIPFFENAFKHGNLEDVTNGWLRSVISVAKGVLQFTASNTIQPKISISSKGGVGLENIRDRLALLYPEKHSLDINEADGIFSVQLTLDLVGP